MLPIIVLFLALFVVFDIIAVRALVRIHPRHGRLIIGATVVGNLLWPFIPLLNARSDFSRFIRATLGPPWFSWAVFTILYCALLLVLRMVWLPLRRRVTFVRFAHWPSRVFLSLILLGGVVGVYQCLEPLRIEQVPVYVDSLPPAAEGYRIALMGDLHVGLFTRPSRLTKIFTTVNALRPNVAILAGDSVDDDPYFVPKLLAGTNALDASIPLVAVLGNHEMYGDPLDFIARLRDSRIHLLVNQGTQVGPIWIAGIPITPRRLRVSSRTSRRLWLVVPPTLSRYSCRISRRASTSRGDADCH